MTTANPGRGIIKDNGVVVLGSAGMLGHDLMNAFSDASRECIGLDIDELDITDRAAVLKTLEEIGPSLVINAAAYTNVDGAETETDAAFKINAEGVLNLALACKEIDAVMVHYSTDYVFDGAKKEGYSEDDPKNPLNAYGKSKAMGENNLVGTWDKHYLVRTSWLFGKNGKNFVKKILDASATKTELRVVGDQFGCPTYTQDLAKKTKELVENNAGFGTYHITNSGSCSWHDFAKEILALKGLKNKIVKIASEELKGPARRPRYSILLNNNTTALPDWKDALRRYLLEEAVVT